MILWTKSELKYYAEYVKLTNCKFFDYFTSLSDEEEEDEMVQVLLKLLIYNREIVIYRIITREVVDIIEFKEFDKIPAGCSWVPSNFVDLRNYLGFVNSLELDEGTGEMTFNC